MDVGGMFWAGGGGGGFPRGGVPRGGGGASRYDSFFRCHSPGFITRPELEHGGKIILPPSALDSLTRLHIEYPMLFEISNPSMGRKTHCGVLEFVAEEGFCYIPYWMMQHLLIEEGQMIQIKSCSLPRGKSVKLQPHTTAFIDISNPRAVLENALRKFACLTKDEVIMINYNNKNFYLTVADTKPADAISIIETDLVLDFEEPLDYKEMAAAAAASASSAGSVVRTASAAQAIPGGVKQEDPSPSPSSAGKAGSFKAFGGSGVRLDGKNTPPMHSPPFASTPPSGGGLSFGAKAAASRAASAKKVVESDSDDDSDSEDEDDEPKKKFVAFGGTGHSLK